MVKLIAAFPFRKDVNHLILTRHRRCPWLGNPAEHATDGARRMACRTIGSSQPRLGKAGTIELAVITSHRPNKRPHVIIDEGIHIVVAVTCHCPTSLRTVVTIVANAHTCVEVSTDGVGACSRTHTAVLLGNCSVCIMHQGITNVVDVNIVGFATVVSVTSAFIGSNTDAAVEPGCVFVNITFVIDHFIDLGRHVLHTLHGETSREDLGVIIRATAFQHAEPVVRVAAIHRVRSQYGIIAYQENKFKVAIRVVIDVLDVSLDLRVAVATGIAKAHHRCGSSRLVLPIHERLHGFHILAGANDKHLSSILNKSISGHTFPIIDKSVVIGGLHLRRHLPIGPAGNLLVLSIVAHLIHHNCHVVVDAKGLRDGIVGKGGHHNVLATEITDNIR